MLDALSKSFFHTLAGSRSIKRLASRFGMRHETSFARRFIAGETLDEAITAARALESRGFTLTLDVLGESVTSIEAAQTATETYLHTIERVVAAGISRNVSLKLTQLGLDLDRGAALDNLRRIVSRASQLDVFVRIDMESSPYVDVTLGLWEQIWAEGFRNVGIVLQSALHRSQADLQRLVTTGVRVRLVKGAYNEPHGVAYQAKSEVDEAFVRMMYVLLEHGHFPAIATHDPQVIETAKAFATSKGIPQDRFEFQMLYGIRRDLQNTLKREGYGVRIYVPFGREWFPYFMRRLGERPANVGFVIKGILGER